MNDSVHFEDCVSVDMYLSYVQHKLFLEIRLEKLFFTQKMGKCFEM